MGKRAHKMKNGNHPQPAPDLSLADEYEAAYQAFKAAWEKEHSVQITEGMRLPRFYGEAGKFYCNEMDIAEIAFKPMGGVIFQVAPVEAVPEAMPIKEEASESV